VVTEIKNGPINVDTPEGLSLGFTRDKFSGYLYKETKDGKNIIYISLIESKQPGRGDFEKLTETIRTAGYWVYVPNAMTQMESILKRWGYERIYQKDDYTGCLVEIYIKAPYETGKE